MNPNEVLLMYFLDEVAARSFLCRYIIDKYNILEETDDYEDFLAGDFSKFGFSIDYVLGNAFLYGNRKDLPELLEKAKKDIILKIYDDKEIYWISDDFVYYYVIAKEDGTFYTAE